MKDLPGRSKLPKDVREALDHAYWEGFELGRDTARRELRDEIAQELEDELSRWDPDCELCVVRRRAGDLEKELARTKVDLYGVKQRSRGWQMRDGAPYRYRDTRPVPAKE